MKRASVVESGPALDDDCEPGADGDTSAPGETKTERAEVERRTGGRAMLAGGTLLAIATMAASGGNYVLNILLGRWLGAAAFSDVNLMVTLMLLATAAAVSLQLIASRFAGQQQVNGTDHQADGLARWLERRATLAGLGLGLTLALGAPLWADFFRTGSAWPFVILGIGMPFYLAQGVGRGMLQGRLQFGMLAMTYVVEMIVRLSLSLALVMAGFGVSGATLGLSISFVATWLAVRYAEGRRATGEVPIAELRAVIAYTGPVAVLLLGQIIINNGDVLIVKRLFSPELAGAYAGVALIGRAVFFLSWSVVTTTFPASTQREEAGSNSAGLIAAGLAAISLIGLVSIVSAVVAGEAALGQVFGEEYVVVARYLPWYAFATSLFAIANLMASFELSIGRKRGGRLLLAGAVVQTLLLVALSDDLAGIVQAQVISMSLLAAVSLIVIGPKAFGIRSLNAGFLRRFGLNSEVASPDRRRQ